MEALIEAFDALKRSNEPAFRGLKKSLRLPARGKLTPIKLKAVMEACRDQDALFSRLWDRVLPEKACKSNLQDFLHKVI